MNETLLINGICGMGISFTIDGFRCVYGAIALLMWTCTLVFSLQYFKGHNDHPVRYHVFNIVTLFATLGVFLSADMFTTFIFFEIMSFTSFVWVAHDETHDALRAACTYLAVAVIGGLFTLMGMFLLYHDIGTLTYAEIPEQIAQIRRTWLLMTPPYEPGVITKSRLYLIGGLLATGFAAKAGVWPLHIWLPKAHPVAPAPASALLSGILTKSGVFGILAITCNMFLPDIWWGRVIMWLGVITMLTGALLAIFSVNIKRTLACSSMSQIGFIMVGAGSYAILGDGGVLSARGLVLHMVNHSMIKLVLFMAAGVIFMNLHKLDLNDIRGWGRKKPFLKICFAIGALSISGVPLFSGYISKTLLHEGIPLPIVEVLFLICGGMTLSYMLKIFIAVFVEENNDAVLQAKYDSQTSYWNMASRIAVCVPAAMLFVMGILPYQIMDRIAELCADFLHVNPDILSVSEVRYFAGENLLGSMISIGVGLVLYFLVIRTRLMKTVARDDMEKGVRAEAGEGTEVAASGEAVEGTDSVAVRANVKEATEGSGVETVRAEAKKTCSIYVDKWPKRLDLEDMIYRPFVLKVLPGAIGFICAVTGQITDSLIILLRRTIFRQVSTKVSTEEMDDHLAIVMAGFLDKHFPKKDGTSRVPAYVTAEEGLARTQRMISSALSFGLILVCVGLILVLIYTLASA